MSFEKQNMFSVPIYKIGIDSWREKKKQILNFVGNADYRVENKLHTDYRKKDNTNKPQTEYSYPIWELLKPYLKTLSNELGFDPTSCPVPNMWSQKYYSGSNHKVHNHGPFGYSFILYLKFNPEVHKPTRFMTPLNIPFKNSFNGADLWYNPSIKEGDLVCFPSMILHESQIQETDEERMILSFNLRP